MNIAWWILSGILVVAFLGAGSMKLLKSPAELREAGMTFVDHFPPVAPKLIGAAEVVGAVGLILPWALDIAPVLTPIAALLLGLLMVGAVATHVKIGDPRQAAVPPAVLAVLSFVVAAARF